jgi:hypothetical protein
MSRGGVTITAQDDSSLSNIFGIGASTASDDSLSEIFGVQPAEATPSVGQGRGGSIIDSFLNQTPTFDVKAFEGVSRPSITDVLISPQASLAPLAGLALTEAPAVKAITEGLKREEAFFANALRSGVRAVQGKELEEVLEGGAGGFGALLGVDETQFGDVFICW